MKRVELLNKANTCISFDREIDYGKAEENFARIAGLWTSYLDTLITPVDVGNLMILLKIARSQHDPSVEDNWVDMIGYAALTGELGARLIPQPPSTRTSGV